MNRFLRIKKGKVVTVRLGKQIVDGEIASDVGDIGDEYVGGEFVKPAPVEKPKPDTATELVSVKALLQEILDKVNAL